MQKFKRLLPAFAASASLLMAAPVMAEDAPSPDMVLAKVGDMEITLGHMIALRAGLPEQYAQIPADLIFPGMLDQLIQHAMLSQAHKGGLSRLGKLSLENEERAIMAEDEAQQVAQKSVSDEAIQELYDTEYANAPQPTEYHAAHILVETEDEAKAIVTDLEGGADFAELAKEKSTGPSGPRGGDLGWFSKGMMVEPFFQAVEAMKVDEISAPVQTEFGWHVIKLMETKVKDRPTLDEVRNDISSQIQQNAVASYIAELEAKTTVERTDLEGFDLSVINNTDLLEK